MIPLLLAGAAAGGAYLAKKVSELKSEATTQANRLESAAGQLAVGTETSAKLSAVAATAAVVGVVLLALMSWDDRRR